MTGIGLRFTRILVGVLIVIVIFLSIAVAMWLMPFKDTSAYTKPAAAPDRVGILAFGDQGSGDFRQRRVAGLLEAACRKMPNLAFVQTLGDNFYLSGVKSPDDPLWHDALQGIYNTPCLEQTPFHALLGNHDEEGQPSVQIAYSKAHHGPIQWYMPANFYVTRAGAAPDGRPLVTLVVIDTNMALEEQIALIDETFRNPDDSIWRIVAGHHNVRTNSIKYHDDDRLRKKLLPALVRNRVDFYLAGHSHNLQLIENPGEPVYVIAGGGGKRPRTLKPHDDNQALLGRQTLGFVALTFDPAAATIQFTETSGNFFSTLSSKTERFDVRRACLDNPHFDHCVKPAD